MFTAGHVDGVWTVEPWVSRLLLESGGKLLYVEPEESCIITVLAVSEDFLKKAPEAVAAFVESHKKINAWMLAHPEEARRRAADELSHVMRGKFPLKLIEAAWSRMTFRTDISTDDFISAFEAARRVGFIKNTERADRLRDIVASPAAPSLTHTPAPEER